MRWSAAFLLVVALLALVSSLPTLAITIENEALSFAELHGRISSANISDGIILRNVTVRRSGGGSSAAALVFNLTAISLHVQNAGETKVVMENCVFDSNVSGLLAEVWITGLSHHAGATTVSIRGVTMINTLLLIAEVGHVSTVPTANLAITIDDLRSNITTAISSAGLPSSTSSGFPNLPAVETSVTSSVLLSRVRHTTNASSTISFTNCHLWISSSDAKTFAAIAFRQVVIGQLVVSSNTVVCSSMFHCSAIVMRGDSSQGIASAWIARNTLRSTAASRSYTVDIEGAILTPSASSRLLIERNVIIATTNFTGICMLLRGVEMTGTSMSLVVRFNTLHAELDSVTGPTGYVAGVDVQQFGNRGFKLESASSLQILSNDIRLVIPDSRSAQYFCYGLQFGLQNTAGATVINGSKFVFHHNTINASCKQQMARAVIVRQMTSVDLGDSGEVIVDGNAFVSNSRWGFLVEVDRVGSVTLTNRSAFSVSANRLHAANISQEGILVLLDFTLKLTDQSSLQLNDNVLDDPLPPTPVDRIGIYWTKGSLDASDGSSLVIARNNFTTWSVTHSGGIFFRELEYILISNNSRFLMLDNWVHLSAPTGLGFRGAVTISTGGNRAFLPMNVSGGSVVAIAGCYFRGECTHGNSYGLLLNIVTLNFTDNSLLVFDQNEMLSVDFPGAENRFRVALYAVVTGNDLGWEFNNSTLVVSRSVMNGATSALYINARLSMLGSSRYLVMNNTFTIAVAQIVRFERCQLSNGSRFLFSENKMFVGDGLRYSVMWPEYASSSSTPTEQFRCSTISNMQLTSQNFSHITQSTIGYIRVLSYVNITAITEGNSCDKCGLMRVVPCVTGYLSVTDRPDGNCVCTGCRFPPYCFPLELSNYPAWSSHRPPSALPTPTSSPTTFPTPSTTILRGSQTLLLLPVTSSITKPVSASQQEENGTHAVTSRTATVMADQHASTTPKVMTSHTSSSSWSMDAVPEENVTEIPLEASHTLTVRDVEAALSGRQPGQVASVIASVVSPSAATAIASTGTASTAVASFISPSAAGQSVRVGSVVGVVHCELDRAEDTKPSLFDHPFQASIGSGMWSTVAGSTLVTTIMFLVMPTLIWGALHMAVRPISGHVLRTVQSKGVSIVLAIGMSYFGAVVARSAVLVLSHPIGGYNETAGVVAVCAVMAVGVCAALASRILPETMLLSQVEVSEAAGKVHFSTVDDTSMYLSSFSAFFDSCRQPLLLRSRCYFFEETLVTMMLGMLDGIKPSSGCAGIAGGMVTVTVLHIAYLVIIRPYRSKLEFACVLLSAVLLALSSIFALVIIMSDREDETLNKVLGAIALGENIVFFLQAVALAFWSYTVQQRRRVLGLPEFDARGSAFTSKSDTKSNRSTTSNDDEELMKPRPPLVSSDTKANPLASPLLEIPEHHQSVA